MAFIWNKKGIIANPKRFTKNPQIVWSQYIPIENKPINYLEIGVHKGLNLIDIANSYCKHPNSRMYLVDPWIDYDDYPEYKGQQDVLFGIFNNNVKPYIDKCFLHRGFSDDIVPTFSQNFFDIIYVDGNHEMEYVYRDAKMAFEKVKPGGYIVFDDYNEQWLQTVKGIDMFLNEYSRKIRILTSRNDARQLILQKLTSP